jgi:hypothetical protein
MTGYIYKVTNKINRKSYIGKRTGKFDSNYFGSGVLIRRAVDKYGKNMFKLELLAFSDDKEKLNALEIKYISEYKKLFGSDRSYNIADGGDGNVHLFGDANPSRRQEVRQKLRKASLGHKLSKESRKKLSIANTGKPGAWKGKKRLDMTGDLNPAKRDEVRKKISVSKLGITFSKAHRERIGNASRGRCWINDGTRNRRIKNLNELPE